MKERDNEYIGIKVTRKQKQELMTRAKEKGLPLSSYIKQDLFNKDTPDESSEIQLKMLKILVRIYFMEREQLFDLSEEKLEKSLEQAKEWIRENGFE